MVKKIDVNIRQLSTSDVALAMELVWRVFSEFEDSEKGIADNNHI